MRIARIAGMAALVWLAVTPAVADDANFCSVPAYLLHTEAVLSNVAEAFKTRSPIRVLVVGSRSSVLSGPDGAASSYPARFEAALRSKLPGIEISVTTDLHPKETAADVAGKIEKIVAERKPTLVVWQTGTVDAMRSIDPDDFRAALDTGLAAVQKADADVILMNLQYSPRMETVLAATNYNDTLRVVAQEHGAPLFDRFSIMRAWSEAGDFDLFAQAHSIGVAARVHDCLGRALSKLVIEAAHINPAELGVR
ncbi:GDSL-type esterase/lipase family protein [[Pseudomonas] carboxydohydrogena]|uniref:GDSL-type esterase/lipase family protein n=1 Tax=Afipia carboxydohydrogena TaxID=290 RepID=A0ABY8BSU8_AFICR|nr:GDSL-type esterase/lipase family protein [[Pseudomonas] carboxydohydrogena]WEF51392.1 GDSL-type esterase/lipase family protein [[Pseudomonas] carboxydohydrogena]